MKKIKQTYHINAPIEKVWDCFVDPKEIEAWGSGPAKMSDEEGGDFSLWGGDIYGTNIKVTKGKRLEQDWYGGKWDKPSKVIFTFTKDGDTTVVHLIHTDLPKGEEQSFADGWKDYYLGAIKHNLEK